MKNKKIANLDSIRGVAVFLVLIAHITGFNQASLGAIGVWIFFVLSGFLLYFYFENSSIKDILLRTPNYFWRRIFRMLPAYFFCLLVYAICYNFLYGASYSGWLYKHIVFKVADGHFWSVKIEFIFYMILPASLIVMFIPRDKKYRKIISMLMIAVVFYIFEYKKLLKVSAASSPDLAPFLTPFYIGIFLSMIRNDIKDNWYRIIFYIGLFAILFIGIDNTVLIYVRKLFLLGTDNIGWKYPWVIYPFAGLIVLGAYKANIKILDFNIVNRLGVYAYSFYLWHILVMNLVKLFESNKYFLFIFTFIITFVLSYLSYKFLEKPFMDLSKKYQIQVVKKN